MKLSVKIAGVLTVAAAAMTAKMYATAKGNHLKTHTFPLSKMKGKPPLTIFFISDIHKRLIDQDLLEKARSHAPHLVIIGGDLAEGGVPSARIEENIKRLVHFGVLSCLCGGIMIMKSGSISCIPYLKRTASSL